MATDRVADTHSAAEPDVVQARPEHLLPITWERYLALLKLLGFSLLVSLLVP